MIVRAATAQDAEAVAVVQVRTWQAAYRGQIPQEHLDRLDPQQRRLVWLQWIEDSPATLLVLDDGEAGVVGFVNVAPSRDDDTDPSLVGEVQAIYVLPGYWDRGAGRLLMRAALDRLRESGFHDVVLWVLDTNDRARRFYEAGGWRPDGATKTGDPHGFPRTEVRYRHTDQGHGPPDGGVPR